MRVALCKTKLSYVHQHTRETTEDQFMPRSFLGIQVGLGFQRIAEHDPSCAGRRFHLRIY